MLIQRVVIFANGDLPNLGMAQTILKSNDFIIAADGGTRHVLALGRIPNIIIGDLDSVTFDLQPLIEKGAQVMQFPKDKNETDLELAINHALTLNPAKIVIVAALGSRLDQTLGNISLMTNLHLSGCDVRLDDGVEEVFFCRNQAAVQGRSGDIVSLIPWQGDVAGVRTSGLKWPLDNETLFSNKTRGISNEMAGEIAGVQIESGLLLIVHARSIPQ